MGSFILRRLVLSIPLVIGVTLVTFAIVNFAPGDPVMALINPETAASLGPDWVEQQRKDLGLDKPLVVRYGVWLKALAKGNLGYSTQNRQAIAPQIKARIWPTAKLMGSALVIGLLIAIPVGVLSALKQYSILDYIVTITAFGAIAIPSFFLGLGGIYIFAIRLGWLPTSGMNTLGGRTGVWDSVQHLILPATVLGLGEAAPLIRYVRSSMLEVIRKDYVNVARAKGLSERSVIYRHAFRNALIPLVTVVALGLPRLFGGTVIIEQIFAWPGMGTLMIDSVMAQDFPVILSLNLIIALIIIASNLIADVLYALIDPRIKYT
jgi:peptide/nickel transport system permease protein